MNCNQVTEYIVQWLNNYAKNAGVRGFVVGISGGIDSALTSTLCAMTGRDTWVVELPIHQDKSQVNRGKEHIAWLQKNYPNVHSLTIDLTHSFDSLQTAYPSAINSEIGDLALANTRSRLRMTTLYYVAGIHGLLVAGTGNKVEDFGVGFFTKYGDGGVDLSPIADLYKSQVYALSRHLGIAESILNAEPTDGLFGDSRTDEEQIGATYAELEWAMEYLKREQNTEHSALTARQQRVLEIYQHRNKANRHKMEPIPVCLIPMEWL